LAPTHRQ